MRVSSPGKGVYFRLGEAEIDIEMRFRVKLPASTFDFANSDRYLAFGCFDSWPAGLLSKRFGGRKNCV